MSVLNQLFNRGLQVAKCKQCLAFTISRIKLLQNKREAQLKSMKKEIAQFLLTGQEAIARIRVEHVIREQNTWESYEILELFCEFVLARVPILESQRECPIELQEAVASIIFAAPKCSDLPDLLHVMNLLAAKYGKEFVAAASELLPDTSVNRRIIEKLSVSAPPSHVKLNVLKDIALEYDVDWDSTKTEAEFRKTPEDLLNGPKQVAPQSSKQVAPQSLGTNSLASKMVSPKFDLQSKPITNIKDCTSPSTDVLQQACIAIAAADRAIAAAREAAELVNITLTSLKLEEQKT